MKKIFYSFSNMNKQQLMKEREAQYANHLKKKGKKKKMMMSEKEMVRMKKMK